MRGVQTDGRAIHLRHDLPEPEPSAGEVVLGVVAVGICETDLQLARGYMDFRGTLGHEFVGLDPAGRRVTAEINNPCLGCPTCWRGLPQHCPRRTVLGILGRDGAMADRVRVPERNIHAIPDAIDDRRAVFIEPLAAAFRVPEQLPIDSTTVLTVVGDGKLGLLCAWVARLAGARVTLVGKHPEKLALAGPGIATCTLEEAKGLARSQQVVVDCTGSTTGLEAAFGLVEPYGTVVLKTTVAGPHAASLAPIVIDEIQVVGSRCGPFPRAIAALEAGEIDVLPLIEAEFPLDRAEEAFRLAATKGAKKVLMTVGDGG